MGASPAVHSHTSQLHPAALIKKPTADVAKLSIKAVFAAYEEDTGWLRMVTEEADARFMRIAAVLNRIVAEKLWQRRVSKETSKPYETFDQWVGEEGNMSRAKIYSLIRMQETLVPRVDAKAVAQLGYSRAVEVARLVAMRPHQAKRAVEKVLRDKMSVKEVKTMVANSLAGDHLDSGRYVVVELSVRAEDEQFVRDAIAVHQTQDPVEDPNNPVADGMHVAKICQDYLLDAHNEKAYRQLKEARKANGNGGMRLEE